MNFLAMQYTRITHKINIYFYYDQIIHINNKGNAIKMNLTYFKRNTVQFMKEWCEFYQGNILKNTSNGNKLQDKINHSGILYFKKSILNSCIKF